MKLIFPFSSHHLIKKKLSSLLLAQVHHLHSHLPSRMLLTSNADNASWPLSNLHVVFQHCPGITLVHHHPQGSFELLMSHNSWILIACLCFRVQGKVKVAGAGLRVSVPGRTCWWRPARRQSCCLLSCWRLLRGASFRNPGIIRHWLVWGKGLGFGCWTVWWTPVLWWPEEGIRLEKYGEGEKRMIRLQGNRSRQLSSEFGSQRSQC